VLLPEDARPFCLFLDELPACAPDIQKAFYSLLLERRLGEYPLPPGTWVVAAGNRAEDRALVRALSSALVNRVILLHVRVDLEEWLAWAERAGIRQDVRDFIREKPESLLRDVPLTPVPFSTPRAWASLAMCLDLAEMAGVLTNDLRRALALGRVTGDDAVAYCERLGCSPTMADAQQRLDQAFADVQPVREALSISAADLPIVDLERLRVLAVRMFQHLNTPYAHLPSMKIPAIKVFREVTKCSLKESKDAVEGAMAMTEAEREQLLAANPGP
jgi:hypothetical protein